MLLTAGAVVGAVTGTAVAAQAGPNAPAAASPSASPPKPHATAPPKPPKAPAGTTTWAVQPSTAKGPDGRSTFTWTNVKPRTVLHDYVGVSNFSAHPVTFQVYATDAFVTSSGSLSLLAAATKPTDVGTWVHVARHTVRVPAHARVNEPFTLTVPANATPGDHTGGVIASVSQKGAGHGADVTVDRRIGVPIYLRVSGALHPVLAIESISTGYHDTINPFGGGGTNVSYTVHNTGNVRLTGTQTVTVTGPFGVTLATAHPTALLQLLPGDSLRVSTHLSGVFPAGPLTVHVRIRPAAVTGLSHKSAPLTTVSRSVSLWTLPWPQLLLLILLAAGGFGLWWWLRLRRRHRNAALAAAVAQGRREAAETLIGSGGIEPNRPGYGHNGADLSVSAGDARHLGSRGGATGNGHHATAPTRRSVPDAE
jgi:hypothetical protein